MPGLPSIDLPVIASLPVIGPVLSGFSPLTYLAFALAFVGHVLLYRHPWGIHLRAVGESPVAAGTPLADGKEVREIGGVQHVLESPIHADVALVYAAKADELGNLWYRRTARNFNPLMATAAQITIAEAGEIVHVGELEPEAVVTPHLYVDYLVPST